MSSEHRDRSRCCSEYVRRLTAIGSASSITAAEAEDSVSLSLSLSTARTASFECGLLCAEEVEAAGTDVTMRRGK